MSAVWSSHMTFEFAEESQMTCEFAEEGSYMTFEFVEGLLAVCLSDDNVGCAGFDRCLWSIPLIGAL